jgi:nickel transport protein
MTTPRFTGLSSQLTLAALAALVGLIAAPGRVEAHAIESSLDRLESLRDGLMLESHFSNGEPVKGATVRLVPPDGGQPVEVGQIDAKGRLSFNMPKGADGNWELQVDAGPGHRDFLEVPTQAGQAQLDRVSSSDPELKPTLFSVHEHRSLLLIGGVTGLGALVGGLAIQQRRRG